MTPQCKVRLALLPNSRAKQPLLTQQPVIISSSNPTSPNSSNNNNNDRKKKKKTKTKKPKKGKKNKIKCVIVGDKEVGKTALAVSYSNDSFPNEYIPTAYDNYNVDVQVDGKPIRVELCDTAGEDGFNPLRNLCYPGTDVFILCFSTVRPASFRSACTRWADELTRLGAPVVLVGTQSDLQHQNYFRVRPVAASEAQALADRLNAPYVETSAKTCTHLKEAFDQAITIALRNQSKKKKLWRKLCCISL